MKIDLIAPTLDKIDVLIDDHVAMTYVAGRPEDLPVGAGHEVMTQRQICRLQANAFALGARFGAAMAAKHLNAHVNG